MLSRLRVAIDIKPGDARNVITLGRERTFPVAILSSASFNAGFLDPWTVTVADAPVAPDQFGTPRASIEDVNGDGRADLLVHVRTEALTLSASSTRAELCGKTSVEATAVEATDAVHVVRSR